VIGNDAAIAIGGMQGHFELDVFVPLIARAREKGVEESVLDEALDYRKMAKPHGRAEKHPRAAQAVPLPGCTTRQAASGYVRLQRQPCFVATAHHVLRSSTWEGRAKGEKYQ